MIRDEKHAPQEALHIEVLEAPPGTVPQGRCADALAAIDAGLHAANLAAVDFGAVGTVAVIARSDAGTLLGGLRGRWWGTAWEVQQLWVDAEHRRRGHATRLLAEFEALARSRGGAVIYLDTFSFQAPALYLGCGFRVAWQVAGFPGAHVKYVMEKRLGA